MLYIYFIHCVHFSPISQQYFLFIQSSIDAFIRFIYYKKAKIYYCVLIIKKIIQMRIILLLFAFLPKFSFPISAQCLDKTAAPGMPSECPNRREFCNNPIYRPFMAEECPLTCGFCGNSVPQQNPPFQGAFPIGCSDRVGPNGLSDCPKFPQRCTDPIWRGFMARECPLTCGLCSLSGQRAEAENAFPPKMVQYKLFYFDMRGRGEPIRLLFNYAKQPFEDVRISFQDWANKKSEFFFGKLPVLEIDGKKQLAQSAAILRYLGGKNGLIGKDEWERAKVNELIDFYGDISMAGGIYLGVKNGIRPGNVEQLRKEFVQVSETNFPLIVKLLQKSGSGFLVALGLTIVDFLMAEYFYTLKKMEPEFIGKFPDLLKFVDRFYALSQLKEYNESRRDSNM